MVFIENEAALLCATMRERARSSTGSYNLMNNFLIYLLPLKSSVFVVHFSNALWHGNEAFLKGSSWNGIVPFLVTFHLPYSKYRCVKICFYPYSYQNRNLPLLSHLCHSCSTRVTLVSFVKHSCRSCRTRVGLVSHSSRLCLALVLYCIACIFF